MAERERQPQVTVQTSALVDDFGAMYFEVQSESISFYFGENTDSIHISFTDQSLLNLARLVNRALKATLDARAVTIPDQVGGGQSAEGLLLGPPPQTTGDGPEQW